MSQYQKTRDYAKEAATSHPQQIEEVGSSTGASHPRFPFTAVCVMDYIAGCECFWIEQPQERAIGQQPS